MSLTAELKRRSVFKVGAAYLVVAWVSAQAAGLAFPAFEAPAWALRVFIFMLMIGFPIALVIAWAVELTPEGIKVDGAAKEGNTRFFIAVAAIAALAVGWYFFGQTPYRADDPQAQDGPPSVAVLPFANLSGDAAQEFFSDGMTEEILNVLVKIPDLKVAARTSVFAFKGQAGDVREIGKKLGVSHIVEGSVRRDGAQIRITAQLIRVGDGFHVWSETYDREVKSVFAVQDEIAKKIAGQLKGSLAKAEALAARADIDPAAYADYLQARTLHRARKDLPRAIALLRGVTAREPGFAQGWAALALSLEVSVFFIDPLLQQDIGPVIPQLREAVARAVALSPDEAMTLHAQGSLARAETRYLEARQFYERAIAADPTYPDVREDLSELFVNSGQDAEALEVAQALIEMEPFVWIFVNRLGPIGVGSQSDELVGKAIVRLRELTPDQPWALLYGFYLARARGDLVAADAAMAEAHALSPSGAGTGHALWRWTQGDPAIDDAVARRAILSDQDLVPFAAWKGDADLFFKAIANPLTPQLRYQSFIYMRYASTDLVFKDPRAKAALRANGFEAYWRATRWPDECQPLPGKRGETDFSCAARPRAKSGG
jgi:TolB-like protein